MNLVVNFDIFNNFWYMSVLDEEMDKIDDQIEDFFML